MAEVERKRLELRRRMEEASKARRAKRSFMTPERKKKLRVGYFRFLYAFFVNAAWYISFKGVNRL